VTPIIVIGGFLGAAIALGFDSWRQRIPLMLMSGCIAALFGGDRHPEPVVGAPVATIAQAVTTLRASRTTLDRDTARRGCIACMTRDCSGSSCWLNAEAACVAGNTGGM